MNYEVTCKHCGRHFFNAVGTVLLEQLPCPNSACRAKLNIKIVTPSSTDEQMRYKFTTPETPPKSTSPHN